MPEIVRHCFDEGQRALSEGSAEEAIHLLEQIIAIYPDFAIINSLLGDAYLENGNSGKAIGIFEELAVQEQNNAGFIGKLAYAYLMRGWHKKAVAKFRQALSLDEDNISLWLGLIDCYLKADNLKKAQATAYEGLKVSNRKGWDNLQLYYYIVQIDVFSQDLVNMKKHLEEMKNKAAENEEEKTNVAWFLADLSQKMQICGLYEESAAAIDAAFALRPDDAEIKTLKKELNSQNNIFAELDKLKADSSIDGFLAEMLDFEVNKCDNKDCLDCEFNQFSLETYIISELEIFRPEILRLKNAYPELYKLKLDFFNQVLDRKKEGFLFDTFQKKYRKYKKLCPEKFEDEDEEFEDKPEPYRRPGPKVGRNDPCPCGSGKKYKKCCGR
jgi:tetratricopeptide (TPR) repeat protein